MTHATEFEAQHGVGARSIERDPKAIYVSWHRLRLRDEMTVWRVETEPMIHVESRHAEFNLASCGNRDARREVPAPRLERGSGLIGQRPLVLFADCVDDAVGRASIDRIRQVRQRERQER